MMRFLNRPSPNFGPRASGAAVDMLLLHYTGMQTTEISLDRMCDPGSEVSAHYLIDEDGTVYRVVDEENRAWHAGASYWRGETDINSRSIGIELQNPGHDWGYVPFPAAQMEALLILAGDIAARHEIPPGRILGHSDISPGRKQDPGHLFDWKMLAENGLGLWPEAPPATPPGDPDAARAVLTEIGYDPGPALETVIEAFQRHWRPAGVDGVLDAESWGRMRALAEQIH